MYNRKYANLVGPYYGLSMHLLAQYQPNAEESCLALEHINVLLITPSPFTYVLPCHFWGADVIIRYAMCLRYWASLHSVEGLISAL